jgi:hypothetical protein
MGVLSSRAIRANVLATFVCAAGVYRKALDRQDTCPFGRVFVMIISSLRTVELSSCARRVRSAEGAWAGILPGGP